MDGQKADLADEKRKTLDVRFLGLAFFLIFIGYSGVQHYVTPYFAGTGNSNIGFESLLFIYGFFVIASPSAARFISDRGAKHAMMLAAVFYSLFIVSLLTGSKLMLYISSALLGSAAAFLWNGHSIYALRSSGSAHFGRTFGFLESVKAVGSALSPLILAIAISKYSFTAAFIVFSLAPLLGILALSRLSDVRSDHSLHHSKFMGAGFRSPAMMRLSIFWFSLSFVFGLAIGVMPIDIVREFDLFYLGVIQTATYGLSILLGYFFGNASDHIGRVRSILFIYATLSAGLMFLTLPGPIFLLIGVTLAVLTSSMSKSVSGALVGDTISPENFEIATSLFWMIQNIGTVSALLLSRALNGNSQLIYLISLGVILLSAFNTLSLLRKGTEPLKQRISAELK